MSEYLPLACWGSLYLGGLEVLAGIQCHQVERFQSVFRLVLDATGPLLIISCTVHKHDQFHPFEP